MIGAMGMDLELPPAGEEAVPGGDSLRILRRLPPITPGRVREAAEATATRVVGVADIECEGLDRSAPILELACRRLRVDADGVVVEYGLPYAFLQDPGHPLDPAAQALTGVTDAELAGRSFDVSFVTALLRSCDVVVCHNAAFDAPRILDRFVDLAGLPFACSYKEVDWRARGFFGPLSLGCLLCKQGLFASTAHRALADVDATIAVLGHRDRDGLTALRELLETAARPTLRFSAYGARFGRPTQDLKARGYRWDREARVWSREVAMDARGDETAWLAANVYAPDAEPKAPGPHVETVNWGNRHA